MRHRRRQQAATSGYTERTTWAAGNPLPTDSSREMLGLELAQSFTGIGQRQYAVAWSADGTTLATTSENGRVGLWRQANGNLRLLPGHSATPIGLAWHPTLPELATGADDKTARVWNAETGKSRVLCKLSDQVKGVAWSPDGHRLALRESSGQLSIWDAENANLLQSADLQVPGGYELCWSSDGAALVTGGSNGRIVVASGDDLQVIHNLKSSDGLIHSTALTADGNLIASGSTSQTVRIWDMSHGRELTILEGHRDYLICVRFSPDGKFLASLSEDELRLWRCRDWECVSTVSRTGADGIGGLDFHPSQPFLAVKDLNEAKEPRVVSIHGVP